MSKVEEMLSIIAHSEGKSKAQLAYDLASVAFPPDDPEVLFSKWVLDNDDIRGAIIALGLEPPEPGPNLLQRVKELVMPSLSAKGD